MKINGAKLITFFTFLCCFILPTYYFSIKFNVDVTKYVFLFASLFVYFSLLATEKKVSVFDFFSMIVIFLLCFIKKNITPMHLIELVVAFKLVNSNGIINKKCYKLYLFSALIAVIIYSTFYFGYLGRYIYTGLKEVNQSGFAVFMLFLLIRIENKKLGDILLIIGILTFSRNYLLCMAVFYFFEFFKNNSKINKLLKKISFKKMVIISFCLLLFISSMFDLAYKKGKISAYQTGINRYLNIFDYSNYFRFSVNTKLIKIYIDNPKLLLTGMEDDQFYKYSLEISKNEEIPYRQIKPHNYFFSYLRIYGIFALLIFWILGMILNKVINEKNKPILVILFIYANILGIGFANYWLFLSIITLSEYRNGGELKYE